ncbi:MATE efflux family protein [Colletotrichum tabaci]|uniref:MATE efflux family protein n=1 Tax=Colletotrichum tabaci TaxID=1209068 RepID=A0AAV9TC12_9PEZI
MPESVSYDAQRSPLAVPPPSENTALLPKPPASISNEPYPIWQWLAEIRLLAKAAVPVILAYTLQNSLQTLSVLIVGRLSPEALATAAFSYMFAMATAWLIALGGTTALDTLASSSFTGSSNKHDLGILLQRGIIVLSAFYMVVAVLWWFSEPVFRALGQEEFISIYRPGTYVLLITSPLNAGLNYLFIHTLGLGLYGAPIATGISYWISFLLLVAYAVFIRGKECWGGLELRKAVRNIGPFAKLAILGVVHVGTEWWAFEIVALAAGRLGTIPLAAQSVIMTADQVINTIPFGLGVAASARIGNLLGAQRPRDAAVAAHSAAILSVILGSVVLITLMATKDVFGKIFNDDEGVVRLVGEVMPYVALFQIADGLNGSCGGVLRGMGRQWVGAVVNLISYYGGALPAGIYLAFNGWGLAGLWIGQCVALYLVGALEWVIVGFSKWDKECQRALDRLDDSSSDGEDEAERAAANGVV